MTLADLLEDTMEMLCRPGLAELIPATERAAVMQDALAIRAVGTADADLREVIHPITMALRRIRYAAMAVGHEAAEELLARERTLMTLRDDWANRRR